MEVRKLLIPVVSVVLVLAVALLYVRVSRSASPEVDPSELAKAESEYKTASARSNRLASSVASERPRVDTTKSKKPTLPRTDTRQERAPEPPTAPERTDPIERGKLSRSALRSVKLPGPTSDADGEQPYEDRRKAVNKLYDRRRFPEAREAATELLKERPTDKRMLRVVVSASCIMFEPDVAREAYQKLPERDKKTMRVRCAHYGVDDLE